MPKGKFLAAASQGKPQNPLPLQREANSSGQLRAVRGIRADPAGTPSAHGRHAKPKETEPKPGRVQHGQLSRAWDNQTLTRKPCPVPKKGGNSDMILIKRERNAVYSVYKAIIYKTHRCTQTVAMGSC